MKSSPALGVCIDGECHNYDPFVTPAYETEEFFYESVLVMACRKCGDAFSQDIHSEETKEFSPNQIKH